MLANGILVKPPAGEYRRAVRGRVDRVACDVRVAATALAESSPEDALYAGPLLGHRQPDTTERHYIRASQMEAVRSVAVMLQQIRDA